MSVLITGVAGFIGARTAELLLNDAEVVGVDNFNDYYDPRLKEHRVGPLIGKKNFTLVKADITNAGQMASIFDAHRFTAVIHLAGMAGIRYSNAHPVEYEHSNVQGTSVLLDEVRRGRVPTFVFASSSSVYAGNTPPFTEKMKTDAPTSVYAATKKRAEALVHACHMQAGTDCTILRYFSVYGPQGRPDMSYFRFIRQIDEGVPVHIFGDGTQRRDFTFIDDIATGTIKALAVRGRHTINLGGSGSVHSVNELILCIEKALGKKAVKHFDEQDASDLPTTCADTSEAARILHWTPSVRFDDGMRDTLAWHHRNRDFVRTLRHY